MSSVAPSAELGALRQENPADQEAVAAVVRQAFEQGTPIYPVGGGAGLQNGLPFEANGLALRLNQLNRVIDYPARDMTITVEAGITIAELAQKLATERQWLPIDAPKAEQATLGGVIAANTSGARRYGHGTIRDFVIGITAVDGRGVAYRAGGRVVKNVAGYDFCKLLVGSMGTLGVVTQVTLKVKPLPPASAWLVQSLPSLQEAETALAALGRSRVLPTAVELLAGPAWREEASLGPNASNAACTVAVGLEGTQVEVDWMLETLEAEWRAQGAATVQELRGETSAALWSRCTEFAAADARRLVVKINVLPSRATTLVEAVQGVDAGVSVQAHAGNGIVMAACDVAGESAAVLERVEALRRAASLCGGQLVVQQAPAGVELTSSAVWGSPGSTYDVMRAVKNQFDPRGLLNPGRFIYELS